MEGTDEMFQQELKRLEGDAPRISSEEIAELRAGEYGGRKEFHIRNIVEETTGNEKTESYQEADYTPIASDTWVETRAIGENPDTPMHSYNDVREYVVYLVPDADTDPMEITRFKIARDQGSYTQWRELANKLHNTSAARIRQAIDFTHPQKQSLLVKEISHIKQGLEEDLVQEAEAILKQSGKLKTAPDTSPANREVSSLESPATEDAFHKLIDGKNIRFNGFVRVPLPQTEKEILEYHYIQSAEIESDPGAIFYLQGFLSDRKDGAQSIIYYKPWLRLEPPKGPPHSIEFSAFTFSGDLAGLSGENKEYVGDMLFVVWRSNIEKVVQKLGKTWSDRHAETLFSIGEKEVIPGIQRIAEDVLKSQQLGPPAD